MAVIAYPIGVAIVEGAAALWALIVANAVPIAVGTAAVGGAVVLNEKLKDKAAPTTNTTTIVGTKTLNCGDNGSYEDLNKKSGENKFDRDHIPSKAALKAAAQKILDTTPALAEKMNQARLESLFGKGGSHGTIANKGQTVAIPKKDHKNHSPTNGSGEGKNTPKQIDKDSDELQKASEKDTKAMEEADGKEMDDECFDKYKKAAKEIRKKTHKEYIKELTELIKDAIRNVP
jgi:hypothetical protein